MANVPKHSARTLCFEDVGVEQGFLRLRQPALAKYAFLGLGFCLAFIVASFVDIVCRGWSTGGQVFIASAEGARLAEARHWIVGSIGFLCMIVMVIARSTRFTTCLSARGFEAVLTVTACLVLILATLQHPWYLVKAFSPASPEEVIADVHAWNDFKLILDLNVCLTGCHLIGAVRWVMLWPVEIAAILVYAGAAVVLGSHVDLASVAMNAFQLSLLVLAAACGKRALEVHERSAFALLAHERTLRCEAEHKLSAMVGTRAQEPEVDAASFPASAYTADLFEMERGDSVEMKLEQLKALGVQEHWLVRAEELQLVKTKVLGKGGYGMATVALYHGSEVVLKASRASRDRAQTQSLIAMAGELRVFRRLHHPNIVMFYGACIDPGSSEIILVLEYIRGQELGAAIAGIPTTPAAVGDRCGLADNICSALSYLHTQTPCIIHGDIKASNILVEEFGTRRAAKLLDFGLSRVLTRRPCNLGGTVRWMAPEAIAKEDTAASPSADIFSLGCVLYMTMTGRVPLDAFSREDLSALVGLR